MEAPDLAEGGKTSEVCHSPTTKVGVWGLRPEGLVAEYGLFCFLATSPAPVQSVPCLLSPGKAEGGQAGSWRPRGSWKGRTGGRENPLLQEGGSLKALTLLSMGFILPHCSSLSEITMFRRRANMIRNLCLCVRPRQCVFCVLLLKNSSCDTATQLGLGLSCVLPTPTGTRWQIFLKV